MTEDEKSENPEYKKTQWYLKRTENKKDLKRRRRRSFEKAEIKDIKATFDIPWFDYEVFKEISWISKEDFDKKLDNKVEFDWKEFINKDDLLEYIKNYKM